VLSSARPHSTDALRTECRAAATPRLPEHLRQYGIILVVLALAAALTLSTDTFLTPANLVNLLDQTAVVGLLACGTTMCLITGVFDLSMSAVLALSTISAVAATRAYGVPAGIIIGLASGVLIGTADGLIVTRLRVHTFIGTLALSIVHRGLALVATGGALLYPRPEQLPDFQLLAAPLLPGGVTASAALFLTTATLTGLLLTRTVFGRHLFAVGGNAEAARLAGIRTDRLRTAVLALSGGCAALAGLVLAARGGSAHAGMAPLAELTAIAATVVGGTSILGGHGAIWRAVAGVVLLTLIGNGFNLLGWDTNYEQVAQGLLILAAVGTDRTLRART
jgi:ribose transport system permease protein